MTVNIYMERINKSQQNYKLQIKKIDKYHKIQKKKA